MVRSLLSYLSDLVVRSIVDDMLITNLVSGSVDYQGVSLTNRDANSKNAASEATSIFQNHYPEFLVSFHVLALFPCDPSQLTRAEDLHCRLVSVPQILRQRPKSPYLDFLGLQVSCISPDVCKDECCGKQPSCHCKSPWGGYQY